MFTEQLMFYAITVLKVKKNNQFLSEFAGNNNSKQDLISKEFKNMYN